MMLEVWFFHDTDHITPPTAVLDRGVPGIRMVDVVQFEQPFDVWHGGCGTVCNPLLARWKQK